MKIVYSCALIQKQALLPFVGQGRMNKKVHIHYGFKNNILTCNAMRIYIFNEFPFNDSKIWHIKQNNLCLGYNLKLDLCPYPWIRELTELTMSQFKTVQDFC